MAKGVERDGESKRANNAARECDHGGCVACRLAVQYKGVAKRVASGSQPLSYKVCRGVLCIFCIANRVQVNYAFRLSMPNREVYASRSKSGNLSIHSFLPSSIITVFA
jgi:hypothetical protein